VPLKEERMLCVEYLPLMAKAQTETRLEWRMFLVEEYYTNIDRVSEGQNVNVMGMQEWSFAVRGIDRPN